MLRKSSRKKHHDLIFNLFLIVILQLSFQSLSAINCQAKGYAPLSGITYYPSRPYDSAGSFKGPFLRLSLGYGIPYGYLGVNGEFIFFDFISLTGGMGYSPGGSSWITGVRIYMNEPGKHFRPRISTLYGTVSVLSKKYGPEEIYENDQGYAYGLGFEWKILDVKRHSLDFDIIMTDYDVPPGYEKKGPEIKFSLGFGRIF